MTLLNFYGRINSFMAWWRWHCLFKSPKIFIYFFNFFKSLLLPCQPCHLVIFLFSFLFSFLFTLVIYFSSLKQYKRNKTNKNNTLLIVLILLYDILKFFFSLPALPFYFFDFSFLKYYRTIIFFKFKF